MVTKVADFLGSGFENIFSPVFNRIALAVFILFLGFIIGRILGLIVKRLLSGIDFDKQFRNFGVRFSIERFLSSSISIMIYVFTLYLSLETLGLTSTIMTLIIIGVIFILGVSFLLAVKDFFPNLLSGVRIKISRLFTEGEIISMREVKGKVVSIGLLETKVELSSGETVIIPNSLFTKRKIKLEKKN